MLPRQKIQFFLQFVFFHSRTHDLKILDWWIIKKLLQIPTKVLAQFIKVFVSGKARKLISNLLIGREFFY